jgi:hypothetical protein
MLKSISVVVPVFNGAENLQRLFEWKSLLHTGSDEPKNHEGLLS